MTDLTAAEIQALEETLDDEYRAWATYDQVIADFGEVRPFTNIREAEARHIEALHMLFARYRLAVPENPWPGKVGQYASLHAACEAGVAAEIANGEMYVRLLAATQRRDVLRVFRNLQEASEQRHLPAFQRCAQRGAGGGRARGPGPGRGGRAAEMSVNSRDSGDVALGLGPAAYAGWRTSKMGAITERLERRLVLELLGNVEGRSLLDVGCGDGDLAGDLWERHARVTGIDSSAAIDRGGPIPRTGATCRD